ncbi:hypothetical protein Taro_025301 [Colocasia esculenta]|uniref:Uncharacterized protein n=1 Tax=Colocasia esculenta TaxID=4460 RepID=A0A843VK46_COLES|nr:hypothetical protein [Colocasia esculenta]
MQYFSKVVSTQCFKYKAKRSSSVDTRSGSVDTRDPSQNTFWANLGQCVDTRSGSVDTRDLPRTPSRLVWDRWPYHASKQASKIAQARSSNTNQARKH